MLKHLCLTAALIALATPAFAEDKGAAELTPEQHETFINDDRAKFKKMTPEQKEAFFKERKDKWDAMSNDEKLAVIEKRRSEMMERMDKKWASMSDEEKIAHAEKRMKRGAKKWKERMEEKEGRGEMKHSGNDHEEEQEH